MYAEIEAALVDVSKYTHYHPDIWRRRGWNKGDTAAAFSMFQYKAQLLSGGYIGHCTLCSLRLAFKVLNQSCRVCSGYSSCKFQVQVTCVASRPLTLNYGDDLWEGRTIGTESADPFAESLSRSIMRLGSVESDQALSKPRRGKARWRKSFFSFKVRH
jgi:hypothetical protein